MQELNPVNLQSNTLPPTVTVHMMEAASEFVVPGIVVPIALPRKKTDTVWFVEVVGINWICHKKENTLLDSYGHILPLVFLTLAVYFWRKTTDIL